MKHNTDEILELYQNGLSLRNISTKTSIDHATVYKLLKRNGCIMRNASESKQKYKIDNYLFSSIDAPWKAYFLGWIWSDGCLSANNSIKLSLSSSDRCVLDYFNRKIFNGERPITTEIGKLFTNPNGKEYKRSDIANFVITNKQVANDLIKLGLCQRKSLTIEYPKINEYHNEFIRGVFEGDGCVIFGRKQDGHRYCQVRIAGSKTLLENILKILKDNNINLSLYAISKTQIYELRTSSFYTVVDFYNFIYGDPFEFALERKRQIFLEIIKCVNGE